MDGLVLIDKPVDASSFDVVRQVRRLAGTRKVGHGGTLDPFASGLLPVALGSATRLLEYLLGADKTYLATMRLGQETDTQDRTGQIVARHDVPAGAADRLPEILRQFTGSIEQVPPMFSALKKDGVPLYRLARRGEDVDRRPRRIRIERLELLEINGLDACFEVTCSKGTYVRTLAHDIGRALGCGAHLTALRRTATGSFRVEDAVRFEALVDGGRTALEARLLSPLDAMSGYRQIELSGTEARLVVNGQLPNALAERLTAEKVAGPICLVAGQRLLAVADCRRKTPKNWGLEKVFNTP
ncbi:MAG: tRNA pseudouridine(55) synthase TruB [Deltaproteobacteria bacterium]|nr:MAG: tRNA pseudouridine(55) synthase TruB [Deltaproteobacteria bacterium]